MTTKLEDQSIRDPGLPRFGVDGILITTPGGNTGDDLITRGCARFLTEAGLDVSVSGGELESAAARGDGAYLSAALSHFDGIVFFSGGGNVGIYPENQELRRAIIAHAPRARGFLVLPQSCRGPEPALLDPRVEVWARDAMSHSLLGEAGIATSLVPDAAFAMADTIQMDPVGSGVLSILRTPGTCLERVAHGFELPGVAADPTLDRPLEDVVEMISPVSHVISDRLHGAIIAVMMRKRTAMLSVAYHKNRSFYESWFRDDPGIAFVETRDDVVRFLEDTDRPTIELEDLFFATALPALSAFLGRAARAVDG